MRPPPNVTPFPTQQARLLGQVQTDLYLCKEGRRDTKAGRLKWNEGVLRLCQHLAQLRATFRSDVDFGRYLGEHGLGKDMLNDHDRAAAVAMGKDPSTLKAVLGMTARWSIQLIYEKEFRFASASKPADDAPEFSFSEETSSVTAAAASAGIKPKPRRKGAPPTPKTDRAYTALATAKAQGMTLPPKKTFAKVLGVSHMAMEKAWDRWHREHANAAKKEATDDERLAGATFTAKGKMTIDDAIRVHKARLDKAFATKVNEEVRQRIATADDHVRKHLAEANRRLLQFEQDRGKKGIFTRAEFKLLLMCVHPDNSASVEVRNRMLDMLMKNEVRLVIPEDPK